MAWWNRFIPSKNERELRRLRPFVERVNHFEPQLKALPDEALKAKTQAFKESFRQAFKAAGGNPDSERTEGSPEAIKLERKRIDKALQPLMAEAFAVVREAGRRVLGMRHYDVQLIGGSVLHQGKIAEMRTGEGKTLVATLPCYLNALAGRGVHVITVNEYLAQRDAEWMGQIHRYLGLEVGVIVSQMNNKQRQAAYNADITYGTNSEFGFDFLRDNMKLFLSEYVQRGAHYAIVDEVDSILIDEARTPLIISSSEGESTDQYIAINKVVPGLRREEHYTIDEKARSVTLTEAGIEELERRLKVDNLYDPEKIEILHHLNQALRAHTLYRRDVDYLVHEGKVHIIDEFTGRVLEGRRWSQGLHQAVEAKEGVAIKEESRTLATITYQNYFRQYLKLSGMTGTAETEAEEFHKIYNLDVMVVPTNKPIARIDEPDVILTNERQKFKAIVEDINARSSAGQPVLVGTTSVEKSEVLSKLLQRMQVPHQVLNAKYHESEAAVVAQAGSKGAVTIATNMAGRGTDILLGGNPEFRAALQADPTEDPEAYAQALNHHQQACETEKQEVLDAGGLHIVGTERHESRRIDNQLRGRAGRQGDPGSSRFYLSLEDDLMRIFGGDRMKNLMHTMGMRDDDIIESRMVSRQIESAQRRVEGHNFDIRKNLLEYDDVMNEQRKAVYRSRRDVLDATPESTKELVLDLIEDVIITLCEQHTQGREDSDEWQSDALSHALTEVFDLPFPTEAFPSESIVALHKHIYDAAEQALLEREQTFGPENFYPAAREQYLRSIDISWKDHLRDMEHLRDGIGLRGYAQRDPKHEYKKEGFRIFSGMMASLSVMVIRKIFRGIKPMTQEEAEARLRAEAERRAKAMQIPSASQGPQQLNAATQGSSQAGRPMRRQQPRPKPQTVKREMAKVGRNDPCPCGSGKKYKKCHGAPGAQPNVG